MKSNEIGFPSEHEDLTTADSGKAQAYIQQLLVVAADDAKNVLLLATVAIAAVVLLAKDLGSSVHEMGQPWSRMAVGAAVALVAAAVLLYAYSAKINQRRMEMVRCLVSDNAAYARELWAGSKNGIAAQWGWLLWVGSALLIVGAAGALVVVGVLVG